jgi:hypothetical protein
VQCLYCDADLKTFRGFFDEDFCSREHREKYSSSFRKALTSFGRLAATAENPVSQTAASERPAPCAPAPDPRVAGFQPIAVLPRINDAGLQGYPPELPAPGHGVEIPYAGIAWSAELDFDERLADLISPSEGTFAVLEPVPAPLHVSSPLQTHELAGSGIANSLEAAGPAFSGEDNSVPGYRTPWTFAEPVPLAPVELLMPWSAESSSAPALAFAGDDDYSQLTLFSGEIRSTPIFGSEITLVHETQLPEFTPAREMLLGDDQLQSNWGQLHSDPEPAGEYGSSLSAAPEMAWRSLPVDRPISTQSHVPVMMPHSLELASARSTNVPALSPAVESQPQLARELAADFGDGDAAGSSAVPHSHEPLKLTFGNLVKIKNWRLRITFAKPA